MARPDESGSSNEASDRARFAEHWRAPDGTDVCIRAIRRDDIGLEIEFLAGLSKESIYQRVLSSRGLLPGELKRLTRIDFDREMALVATMRGEASEKERKEKEKEPEKEKAIGIARYVVTARGDECEFAIIVADAWQGKGLGQQLLLSLIGVARSAGLHRIVGSTLATNDAMKRMAQKIGFVLEPDPADSTVTIMSMTL